MRKLAVVLAVFLAASCTPDDSPTCGTLNGYGQLQGNYFVVVDNQTYYVDSFQNILGFENGLGSFVCL
tara:strand:+ start:4280 stop:4483 length:204 start_codon:yes stop_codon:yes gene_type:complete